jgi:Arc/MetJ-type ribon-helix-helix transcriptional regulator
MKPKLKRVLIGLPEPQLKKLDRLVESGEYPDRNEAVRAGVRELLERREQAGCTA